MATAMRFPKTVTNDPTIVRPKKSLKVKSENIGGVRSVRKTLKSAMEVNPRPSDIAAP
jgi:hypothetical protein